MRAHDCALFTYIPPDDEKPAFRTDALPATQTGRFAVPPVDNNAELCYNT